MQGEYTGKSFTAEDCFEIGRAAYNSRDYYHCLQWMMEAEERMRSESNPRVSKSDLLEYTAYALYQQGNIKRALALTKQLVRFDPYHPRAAGEFCVHGTCFQWASV